MGPTQTSLHYFLCQVSTICLNWKRQDCCLPRWGPVIQWKVWVRPVKLSVWTLLTQRCPQALGNRQGRNAEKGMSLFFRRYKVCMLLSVVAKRDGDVYVIGCAYSRVSDACVFSSVFVALSCPTLCDPVDCSPPGSSVHGISQARRLEWVAISSTRRSSTTRNRTHIYCAGRQILCNIDPPNYLLDLHDWENLL